MTPDLLSKINGIVNRQMISQNLSETENDKKSTSLDDSTPRSFESNPSFKSIVSSLTFRDAKRKRISYSHSTGDIENLPKKSYIVIRGDKVHVEKINNRNVNVKVKSGDLIFKEMDGKTSVIRKADVEKIFKGTVGGNLIPKDVKAKAARYNGSQKVGYTTGSEPQTLNTGDFVVREGDKITTMSPEIFRKTYEL